MPDLLPRLENPNDSGLAFEVAVFRYTNVSFFVFFFGLLELNLVDFDPISGMREVGVEGEGVGGRDVSTAWVFKQRLQFGAGKGLEGAVDFGFSCGEASVQSKHLQTCLTLTQPGLGEDVLVCQGLAIGDAIE